MGCAVVPLRLAAGAAGPVEAVGRAADGGVGVGEDGGKQRDVAEARVGGDELGGGVGVALRVVVRGGLGGVGAVSMARG